jgi:hypothetical protein
MNLVTDARQYRASDVTIGRSGYQQYLQRALDALFRPAERNGFWDPSDGRIIRALNCRAGRNGDLVWSADRTSEWRYAPFAAMGVMRWRTSSIADGRYDEKIRAFLAYLLGRCHSSETFASIPGYGLGPLMAVFGLAGHLYQEERYRRMARRLHGYSAARYRFADSEETLLLYGWCFLHQYDSSDRMRGDIEKAVNAILARQDRAGLFHFENSTTRNFQNQMYALWALGKAAEVLFDQSCLPHIELTLDAVKKQNMLDNGAFLWEGLPFLRRVRSRLAEQVRGRTPAWRFLFSCHQTFFVNAVCQYWKAGGERDYGRYVFRAIDWLFGGNVLGRDLVEISGLGIPMRMMTPEGRMLLSGQQFIGAYEVGTYIMALTELLVSLIPARGSVREHRHDSGE